MNLLILGATGKVGRLVMAAALEQGHTVTAFVRDPAKLSPGHPHLGHFAGDARDGRAIAAAMARQDAVISALGHNSAQTSDVLTAATRAVLANLTSKQRFISLTGDGVGDPHDPPPPLGGRLVNFVVKLLPGKVFADGAAHAALLRASAANWVLVRSPRMTGGPATHHYRTGYLSVGFGTSVTRADVADFMLSNLTTDTWLRQAPVVASP